MTEMYERCTSTASLIRFRASQVLHLSEAVLAYRFLYVI